MGIEAGEEDPSQTSPLVKEWADMLLFANYKTYSVAVDEKGKKHKAQGGKRVMYTSTIPAGMQRTGTACRMRWILITA